MPVLLLFVSWEGSRAKIDHRKKGTLVLTSLLEDLVKIQDPTNPNGFLRLGTPYGRFSGSLKKEKNAIVGVRFLCRHMPELASLIESYLLQKHGSLLG